MEERRTFLETYFSVFLLIPGPPEYSLFSITYLPAGSIRLLFDLLLPSYLFSRILGAENFFGDIGLFLFTFYLSAFF